VDANLKPNDYLLFWFGNFIRWVADGCKQKAGNDDNYLLCNNTGKMRSLEMCIKETLQAFNEADDKQHLIDDLLLDCIAMTRSRLLDGPLTYRAGSVFFTARAARHFDSLRSRGCYKIIALFNTYVKVSGLKPSCDNSLVLANDDSDPSSLGLELTEDGYLAVVVSRAFHNMFCTSNMPLNKVVECLNIDYLAPPPPPAAVDLGFGLSSNDIGFGLPSGFPFDSMMTDDDLLRFSDLPPTTYQSTGLDDSFCALMAEVSNKPEIPAPVLGNNDLLLDRIMRELDAAVGDDRMMMMRILPLLQNKVTSIRTALYGSEDVLNTSLGDVLSA
jgi:hypothetical protein